MGIAGLLPQLRSVTHKAHVSKYRGQTGERPPLSARGGACAPPHARSLPREFFSHPPTPTPARAVAIDAYCLLHRGAYACSRELVEGEPTDRHVQYCMSRVALLTSVGVTPLVVFDGGRLPNTQDEERTRERNREENKARARALWQQGNKTAAMECYQKAVDITPAHAKQFIEVGAGQRMEGERVVGLQGESGCSGRLGTCSKG